MHKTHVGSGGATPDEQRRKMGGMMTAKQHRFILQLLTQVRYRTCHEDAFLRVSDTELQQIQHAEQLGAFVRWNHERMAFRDASVTIRELKKARHTLTHQPKDAA